MRNFQPTTDSLLRRQYVDILTSKKQSKEPENRDTLQKISVINDNVSNVSVLGRMQFSFQFSK